MAKAERFDSITAISRDAWNACFPGELENYDYYVAIERAHIQGFTHAYYTIKDGEKLLAAVPAFFSDYDLSTTAEGAIRKVMLALERVIPMTMKLACLGSSETEICTIGMHPTCDEATKRTLFPQLLRRFLEDAKARNCGLRSAKDISASDKILYDDILTQHGFQGVGGMPTALLPINFSTIEDYLSQLSSSTRKDMRRKLKKLSELHIEHRKNIDDVLSEVHSMYLETKARSDLQFEELTPEFFQEVLNMEGGLCTVYFLKDKPIAANLLLMDQNRLLDKFFCMEGDIGHAYGMYFLSWFTNLQLCLDKGIKLYQSGQAGYETKLRLRSTLSENTIYFSHRNALLNGLLKLVAPMLAFDVPEQKA